MAYQRPRALSGGFGPGGTPGDDAWLALVPIDGGGASWDWNALQPGDLIVSTSASWISERIRNGTRSPVSHIGIYIGDGQVIEAVGDGVMVVPIATALEDDWYAAAFRPEGLAPAQQGPLVRWLRSQVGKSYDYVAIATLLRYEAPENWFCSELVFAAFQQIGLPLGPMPSQSNPGDVLTISGVRYLGHLKYPPNVMSQSVRVRALGPFTPGEDSRDAMVPPGGGGMSIESSVLQVGDLVIASSDSALGAAIRARTGEPASHVALYIGNGEVVEAIGQGVTRRPLADTLGSTHYAAAYRYVGLSAQQQQTIRDFALQRIGQPFDTLAIVSLQRTQDSSAWFCSELVLEAYAAAGISLGDSQRSTPGSVITMSGFEYLGHLPAAGYVQQQSYAGRRNGAAGHATGRSLGLWGDIVKQAVVGAMGDVTWKFDKLDGKWNPLHERWSADQRAAHDAPARPYTTSDFTTTEMRWDLGNIGATIPVSFEYNGFYVANLLVQRPINIDENFLYKLDMSADISRNNNVFTKDGQGEMARVDLRITWLFDYEGFTKVFQNFVEDTFTFVEEYRIYANGDVIRKLSGHGRTPRDLQFMDRGQQIPWFEAIRRQGAAQSLSAGEGIDLVPVNFDGDWQAVTGSGAAPVVSEQSAHELRARQLALGGARRQSSRMISRPMAAADIEGAVQAGMEAGGTEAECRDFLARMTRSQSLAVRPVRSLDATVYLPDIEWFNSWQSAIVKRMISGALVAITPETLLDYCTANNRTIGLGLSAGAGLGGAVSLGAGVVFAPGRKIGFYGAFSLGGGWNFEAGVAMELTHIYGDESKFAGRAVAIGGSLDLSEGPGVGARMLLEPGTNQTVGWIAQGTLSVGMPFFSAVEATIAESTSVTTFAVGRHSRGMLGGLPLMAPSQPMGMAMASPMPLRHRGLPGRASPWR